MLKTIENRAMKTTVIDIRDLLSPLSARGVEKQLAALPGVMQVEVNYASGNATVRYDETLTGLDAIQAKVRECGHHCSGELVPRHLRKQAPLSSDTQITVYPAVTTPAPPTHGEHTAHVVPDADAQATHAEHADRDSMGHEMGHGAGMDMMARYAQPVLRCAGVCNTGVSIRINGHGVF